MKKQKLIYFFVLGIASQTQASEIEDFLLRPTTIKRPVEHGLSLMNVERRIIKGTKTPQGGCIFDYSSAYDPNRRHIVDIEIARDHTTCESLIETGEPPDSTSNIAPAAVPVAGEC